MAPVLPTGCQFTYLDEGAANVVYQIAFPHSTPPPSLLEDYGGGTPPPTEIADDEEGDLSIFQSKHDDPLVCAAGD